VQVVGRLAVHVAKLLQGKHKPTYVPNVDCGDYVVVVNAKHVRFTGRKETDKTYYRYSGYPGGLKEATPALWRERHPEKILETAVMGMLPKNKLRKSTWIKKLLVFPESAHDFERETERWSKEAPAYVATHKPTSKRLTAAVTVIDLEDDVFPGKVDPKEWDESLLDHDQGVTADDVADEFAKMWALEIAHWAADGEQVPKHIYDLHGLPYPGADVPSLTAPQARDHFLASLRKAVADKKAAGVRA
jgi:large subunit ribosomal protein L13